TNVQTCDGWMGGVSCSQIGIAADFRKVSRGPGGLALTDWGPGEREGDPFMLHVTCDLCGKELAPGEDHRYVVKMEVFAAHDPARFTDADWAAASGGGGGGRRGAWADGGAGRPTRLTATSAMTSVRNATRSSSATRSAARRRSSTSAKTDARWTRTFFRA